MFDMGNMGLMALKEVDDDYMREQLKIGYISLADFVPDHEANIVNARGEELKSMSKMSIEDFKKYVNNRDLKRSEDAHKNKIWDKINKDSGELSEEISKFLKILNK